MFVQSIDINYTKTGKILEFLCPVSVQKYFIGQDLNSHLTGIGHGAMLLERDCTDLVLLAL